MYDTNCISYKLSPDAQSSPDVQSSAALQPLAKLAFIVVCLSMVFSSCKVPSYNFQTAAVVNHDFVNSIPGLLKIPGAGTVIDIKGFRAVIAEKLVSNDNLGEYMLMNEASKKQTVDIEVSRYRNELYYFECRFEHESYGVLLSAAFMGDNNIGAGPMYIGLIDDHGSDQKFLATALYTVTMPKTGAPKIKKAKLKSELRFFYRKQRSFDTGVELMRIHQVVELNRSKLAMPIKPSIYDIAEIFNDPDALLFTPYNDR